MAGTQFKLRYDEQDAVSSAKKRLSETKEDIARITGDISRAVERDDFGSWSVTNLGDKMALAHTLHGLVSIAERRGPVADDDSEDEPY